MFGALSVIFSGFLAFPGGHIGEPSARYLIRHAEGLRFTVACAAFYCAGFAFSSAVVADEPARSDHFQSWIERRDEGVVKQRLDYSCGIAALATLLRLQSIANPSEAQLIERFAAQLDTADNAAIQRRLQSGYSLADLAALAAAYGAKPIALRLNAAQLRGLKIPVIARLQVDTGAHFTVLAPPDSRSVSVVSLADPSWGNRRMLRHQFLDLWLEAGGESTRREGAQAVSSANTPTGEGGLQATPQAATGLIFAVIPAVT